MYAIFNRFELRMTRDQAESASHSGQCDADVEALLLDPEIKKQLDALDALKIREELREYGAWGDTELTDESANRMRIVWIAAGNITDGYCQEE